MTRSIRVVFILSIVFSGFAAQAETWTPPAQAFWAFVGAVKKNGLCGWFGSRGGGGVSETE